MEYLDKVEIRRIQALTGARSLTLVFPKQFAVELGIEKGDYLKCHVDGNRLIVQKLDTEDNKDNSSGKNDMQSNNVRQTFPDSRIRAEVI
jgi:bifunctional DNA-binding transcriptional regulator/antitoxin component of YhaV-PrlF toxin-antitoxin module